MGFEYDSDIEDDDNMVAALLPQLGKTKVSSEDGLPSSFRDDKVSAMLHISIALNRAPHLGGRSR